MTAPATPPICQWCRQPVEGEPAWWDGEPQYVNPFECDKRTMEVQQ
ncbi:hypothetical protein [Streptomyces sp. NPDC088258]